MTWLYNRDMSKPIVVNESDKRNKDGSIMGFAGIWKDIDAKKIKKYIYEGRKDKGKLKRKLPDLN